jgi:hypothetical protein
VFTHQRRIGTNAARCSHMSSEKRIKLLTL